jgi:hypothetical protein
MRTRITQLLTVGFLVVFVSGCNLVDDVEPVDIEFREPVAGELFYHPFTLEMQVNGPDCAVEPLVKEGDDDAVGTATCVGPVEVYAYGWGAVDEGPYAARTRFVFDPVSCACGGEIRILYENPNYSYTFKIAGHGKMDNTIMTSDEIKLPLDLIAYNGPHEHEGVFIGNLILQRPSLIAEGQDGIVSVHACIQGRFYALNYPVATE